jgi:predicted permease
VGHRRFRRLFHLASRRARDIESDLRDEIDSHIALGVEALVRRGVNPATALEQARARFGDFDTSMRTLAASARQREGRMERREWLDMMRQDLLYALRQLRRAPGFTAAVVVTLALGIGANAVMFGIVDRLLLSPPPHVQDAESVVRIQQITERSGVIEGRFPFSNWPTLQDMRSVPSFTAVGGFGHPMNASLGRGVEAVPVELNSASASFFTILGVRPELGRFFLEEEDALPAGTPVVVIGYDFWRRQMGSDRGVLGRRLEINGNTYTVVGVAPRDFNGVDLKQVDVWIPLVVDLHNSNPDFATDWRSLGFHMVARLAPGASPALAIEQASAAYHRGYEGRPGTRDVTRRIELSSVIAARGPNANNDAKVAAWLLGVAGMVLLIACANVATLLLARALRRQQEIAVRLALGISRGRLFFQTVADSFLLAILGAAAALLTAHFFGRALQAWLLPDLAIGGSFLSRRVVAIVIAAIILTGILIGLAPALQARRIELSAALKSGGRSSSAPRSRARTALLILQAALSVMLLVGSGLFVRSLQNAAAIRLGMDTNKLILAEVNFAGAGLPRRQQDAFWRTALDRVANVSGVSAATLTEGTPFRFSLSGPFSAPGVDSIPDLTTGGPYVNSVSPAYFTTLGTRTIRGRPLTDADVATSQPLIVINETMARLVFPNREPLGICVKIYRSDSIPCATIVGVVEDVARFGITEEPTMQYYVPLDQRRRCCSLAMIVRTSSDDPDRVAVAVRRELQAISPDTPFPVVKPYSDLVDPHLRAWKLGAVMFTLFGGLAFGVSLIGLYGLLAYSVAQRRFEFGVRVALGAQTHHIARIVISHGVIAMLAGLCIGLGAAAVAGRWTEPLLFHISPHDVAVYASVALVVIIATMLASIAPSRRAARTDPMVALRAE